MDQHPFFAYLSRMRYINRWGLMRNTFQENIQEHSHMVAVLSHALAVIRRDVFGKEADPGLAAMAALYHDAPEILTGDLPTPIKYYDPEIRDAYKKVEEFSAGKLLAMLPEQLRPAFSPLLREDYDPDTHALVKAADKLSAHIKCLEELKAGNSEFQQAARQTQDALKSYDLPEVDYFLEHFLPAFGMTLDEMGRD
ncbi:5'-deoxynucleotidase [Flavonifractor porci]|uniref:5'-deoxynucleotidase n=1 Tax=Flavonifractor porci TaxID=3133422 RepID=UPI0030997D6C